MALKWALAHSAHMMLHVTDRKQKAIKKVNKHKKDEITDDRWKRQQTENNEDTLMFTTLRWNTAVGGKEKIRGMK